LLYSIADKLNIVTKYLIANGADVNGIRKYESYPLEMAASHGSIEAIKLLDASGRLEYNRKSDRSLSYAAAQGYYEIVEYLLEKGMDVNKKYNRRTPLHWATQEGNINTVRLLIEHHANVNECDDYTMDSPLYQAASDGQLEIVELLLTNGAEVDRGSECTPFMIACSWEHFNVAKRLLDAGANIDYRDSDGRTSLFLAKIRDKQNIIDFLIDNGASMDVIDNAGISILDLNDADVKKRLFNELFACE
jgi:ankyrin repeat protein